MKLILMLLTMKNLIEEYLIIEETEPMDYVNFSMKYIKYLSEKLNISPEDVFENLCVKIAVMLQYNSVINNNIVNYNEYEE